MRKITAILIGVFVTGCTVYRLPVVQPFVDGEYWILREPMHFEIGKTNEFIIVPKGFVTDFASAPFLLKPLFPKSGRYIVAAIVHDYLYWNQSCTKEQADSIFELAMKDAEIGSLQRKTMWAAVDNFGGEAWENNLRRKIDGYLKVVPSSYMEIPFDVPWSDYVETLKADGIEDADSGVDLSAVCRMSDTI